jgi:hypothetical protein
MYVKFFFKIHKLLIIIFLLNIILFNSLLIGDSQGAACNEITVGSKKTISGGACNSNRIWLILVNPEDSVEISDNTTITFSSYSYPISLGGSGGINNSSVINRGVIIQNNYHSVITFYDGSGMSLVNYGTIGPSSGDVYGTITLWGNTQVESITNFGTITSPLNNKGGIDNYSNFISNSRYGTIVTLNNSQGGNSPLTYSGQLPTNYNIIISDQNNYGKLEVYNKAGRSNFGIYNTSIVSTGTYQDVLTGVTLSDFYSISGTYNSYIWNLIYDGTNLDLEITPSRSAYNVLIGSSKYATFASKLETIRTNGTKTSLTNILDNLSAPQLESAVKKIQGINTVKTGTQSVQAQSNFKTALSTVTSPGSSSKITNVTKTNQGNLTFADLQTNNLYAKIQPTNYSDNNAFFDHKNNQAPVNALEFFKSNRNLNLVEKDDLKESGFFLRTFGSITNYAAVNSDDNSYGSDSYGLLGGFQHKIDENLYQGYSLGLSKSKLTLDVGEGNTKTNTIHANVYRKMDEKEYGATASLGGYVSFIDNVRNISETSEILKSSPTNGGVDFSLQYVKKMELLGLNFYPSASFTTTYGIIKNYKETGGSGSALEIKSHNVLAIKPEIGFTLENNFVQTDKITEGANFSLFANRQQYLDGHTNTSSMIGENSWNASTLPKTKDDFLTAGIGYVAKNIDEKSDLNFNFFYTQSTNNSLNSSLFSISYNKTF